MPESLTAHTQDYLKAIYALSTMHSPVSTNALAERLGVTAASVTGMIQRMAAVDPPLVAYQKYQGVRLTAEGERAALRVIRSHRLLEAYLVEHLGYPWDAVHEEACRLEHVLSPELTARIAAALGEPQRDPHGELIPTDQLTMPAEDTLPLADLHPPQQGLVRRVEAGTADFLRYLESVGLVPGVRLEVLEASPYDGNLRLRINANELVLGPAVTGQVFVEVLEV